MLTEGQNGTLTVNLSADPGTNLIVSLTSSNPNLTFIPSTLNFSPVNYANPRTVVLATNSNDGNEDAENYTITLSALGVTSVMRNLLVLDKDTRVLISGLPTNMNEGQSASFSVKLSGIPGIPVIVNLSADVPSFTLAVTSLNFDNTNWSIDQTVGFTASDDTNNIDETATLTGVGSGLVTGTMQTVFIDGYPTVSAGIAGYSGNTISVPGTNFLSPASLNTVTVGGVTASVTSGTSTSLSVIVPLVPGGLQTLVVTNTRGNTTLSGGVIVLLKTSCKTILSAGLSFGDTVYYIDPDGGSVSNQFQVYCDMTSNGGGWTLALKADGTQSTFQYDASYWTVNNTLGIGAPDASLSEYKSQSFNTVGFSEILIVMNTSGTIRTQIITITRTSLLQLFQGGYVATSIGRSGWKNLVAGSSLQLNCNKEGSNNEDNIGGAATRIGILGNQENDCDSCDSSLGIGNRHITRAGNFAHYGADNGDQSIFSFGYLYVR